MQGGFGMNSYDRRQERLARELRITGYENKRRAEEVGAKKRQRKIDMALIRAETAAKLRELTFELEPVRSKILLDAGGPILASGRAAFGMILVYEGFLRENQIDTEVSPWKERLDTLKKEVSESTDPNKYYIID